MFPLKLEAVDKLPFPIPPIPGWDPDTNPWDDYLYPPLSPRPKALTSHRGECATPPRSGRGHYTSWLVWFTCSGSTFWFSQCLLDAEVLPPGPGSEGPGRLDPPLTAAALLCRETQGPTHQ